MADVQSYVDVMFQFKPDQVPHLLKLAEVSTLLSKNLGTAESAFTNTARAAQKIPGVGLPGPLREISFLSSQLSQTLGAVHPRLGALGQGMFAATNSAGMMAMGMGGIGRAAAALVSPMGMAVATIGSGVAAVGAFATSSIKANFEYERLTRNIAGALSGAFEFQGAVTPMDRFRMSTQAAAGVMAHLEAAEVQTGRTAEEMAMGFKLLLPAAENAVKGPMEVEKAVKAASLASHALGVGAEEAYYNLQMLMLTGTARGEFSKALGLTAKEMNKMTDTQRWDYVVKKMESLGPAGTAAAQTVGNQWKMTMDSIGDVVREEGVPFFEVFNDVAKDVLVTIREWEPALRAVLATMAVVVTAVWERASQVASLMKTVVSHIPAVWLAGKGLDKIKEVGQGLAEEKKWQAGRAGGAALAAATVKMEQHLHGDIYMQQDFKDVEPERVAFVIRKDLESLGERRLQSQYSLAHGT